MAYGFSGKSGSQFGRFRIVRQIGAGGMGAVYHAVDEEHGRDVALKLLPLEAALDPRRLERFRREAVHGDNLHHENIVAQHEFGCCDGVHYLVLEYIDGIDLEALVRRRTRLTPAEACTITEQLARALDHAYGQGIVHRDVKPANILLTQKQGRLVAKLADLGLARAAGTAESRVTSDGCTVGTVDFMAPEQARDSARADTRSDIYSLGCTLFYMLAGTPPFAKGTLMDRVIKHAASEPPDLCRLNQAVPGALWDLCRRMLAKRPADRFQTPAELLIALSSLTSLSSEADRGGGPSRPTAAQRLARPGSRRNGRGPASAPGSRAGSSSSRIPSSPAFSNSAAYSRDGSGSMTNQRRVAYEQYERARTALNAGNDDYALSLLLTCCRLEPGAVAYRQALREAQRQHQGVGSWRAWPRRCWHRLQFELARRRHQPLEVLASGEDLLSCAPYDVDIERAMAEAASSAELPELAIWLLEDARGRQPAAPALLRRLALLYEEQGERRRAGQIWQELARADQHDGEARRHLQGLAVHETSVMQRASKA